MDAERLPALAALAGEDDVPIDAILAATASLLAAGGHRVAGVVQAETEGDGECCATMTLTSLGDGRQTTISQALGRSARGCRVDPQALAAVAGVLIDDVRSGADALIVNRFGKEESEGRGFRTVIEAAIERGIPTVVGIRAAHAEAWQDYSGGMTHWLEPDPARIADWIIAAGKT